ncbi:DNA oxidative demethylase AlkB [Alcaligenaceae bacterium]|nr:DNA oxidative demethylase AlkB [Alcaligenaceae bacterium]
MTLDLFESTLMGTRERLGQQAYVLRGFALPYMPELLQALAPIQKQAPFRHMHTPGGYTMSVALTNCGRLGWTSDHTGYRYTCRDPLSGLDWPAMPATFLALAQDAAQAAEFTQYAPDACLINRYLPGSKLSMHQDRNEKNDYEPIVSVSLGIPAIFLFGGHQRNDKATRVPLFHGDIVVWGGVDRMRYHGVLPIKDADHLQLGRQRTNLTFRTAGLPNSSNTKM